MSYRIGCGNSNENMRMLGTVTRIDETGIIMQTGNKQYGIIPTEYLKQQELNLSDFRVGESFTVFSLSKRRKGGRQKIEIDGQPVLCLHHKSKSGKIHKSSKLERIQNHISVAFEQLDEKGKKDYLFDYIESLFWNPIAYVGLCTYCETGTMDMDENTCNMLIANYVLNEDRSIPRRTREVVYELTTGIPCEDFDDDIGESSDCCKIIDFNEALKRIHRSEK